MEMNKKIPILRFVQYFDLWTFKNLNKATSYVDYRGKTPEKTKEGVFLVTAKNIKMGYIDYVCSKEYISFSSYNDVMRRGKPLIGDVLITTEAPLGNVASIDQEGIALAQRVIKFRGESEILLNCYLKHYFTSTEFQRSLESKATGSTAKGIKGSVLHKMEIAYPSLPEQQKIADFLTSVDTKIQQLSKKKALLEEYKKGVMQKLFNQEIRFKDVNGNDYPDWEEKRLGEIAYFLDGRRKPLKGDDRAKIKGIYPYYGASGIIDYVNDYIFDEEIILLGEDGENILSRNLPLAFKVSGKCWINNHAHVLKPVKEINIDFLTECLERVDYSKYNTGTAQPKLNQEVCKSIPLSFPVLEEQDKISGF